MNTVKRYSKQRQAVFTELSKVTSHPTADEVYSMTKAVIPNISMGTVYRNLKNLEAEGKIISFTLSGKERFDCNIEPHMHLCCRICGSVNDLSIDNRLKNEFFNKIHFKINNIVINGICENCAE